VNAKDKMKITEYNEFTEEDETYEIEVDDKITSFTVGVGFRMDSGLSILGGFRSDTHKGKDDDEGDRLKINGVMVTLVYTIR